MQNLLTRPHSLAQLAHEWGIPSEAFIPYGTEAAKLDFRALSLDSAQKSELILVTGMTPSRRGVGKTVTTIGLTQALNRLGHRSVATLREPSLGPLFGTKGGGAGGGQVQLEPHAQLNLHFTGDLHAVGAAHNLAAAAIEARLYHELRLYPNFEKQTKCPPLQIDPEQLLWPRVLDQNDRALRALLLNYNMPAPATSYPGRFCITAASELMAILALSTDFSDLRKRVGRVILAKSKQNHFITADDLEVAGAMSVLLRDALFPNLIQTRDGSPVVVHTGPFANIAHGNASVLADRVASNLAEYVVTEAGFASDMGMEKFFHIKFPITQQAPVCVVLVCTLDSIQSHALGETSGSIEPGLANLRWHIQNVKRYGVPVVVSINPFEDDPPKTLKYIQDVVSQAGADGVAVNEAFQKGSVGALHLAQEILRVKKSVKPHCLYTAQDGLEKKLMQLATKGYGATDYAFAPEGERTWTNLIRNPACQNWPLCVSKTPFSVTDNPNYKGAPHPFTLSIQRVTLNAGAGFIGLETGTVVTMPGLGVRPSYRKFELHPDGTISGPC